ncbi:Hypothetical protein LOCK908_1244 [Lacticaseibacillus rhamnosus LOCK908]|nr:conserved hypothetical protein [Lacticaseibacillus rhamnosus ATCC 8530]AGP73883.1 Hypothetical protein LOCK908_1244 [Lacticaseibacillus rhamnosus LOCK908]ASY50029.1 hypothetical protein N507_2896 [Lacticaseibacillus rhamnosus DSM 14870]
MSDHEHGLVHTAHRAFLQGCDGWRPLSCSRMNTSGEWVAFFVAN